MESCHFEDHGDNIKMDLSGIGCNNDRDVTVIDIRSYPVVDFGITVVEPAICTVHIRIVV